MPMNIYHFHPESGVFLEQGLADPDPLNEGQYLLPAYSTTESPPVPVDGFYAKFENGVWSNVAKPVVEPTPTPTPDEIKASMWRKIKAERDRRIQNGGYKVGAKWYHSDTFSRTQQMGLVMLGANIPANTPWKTMDGTFVVMTQTLANQIFGTAAASDIAIFTAAETHNAAMNASATPETYNYLTGWPVAYGE